MTVLRFLDTNILPVSYTHLKVLPPHATYCRFHAALLSAAQSLSEGIDDGHALDLSAMAHIFGIQFLAPERTRRGDDGGIPI